MNSHRLSRIGTVLFLLMIVCVLFILSSAEITEPIRDGDYIYIDDSKAYLKGTYSVSHGEDIEHWAMTKQFTGDCDMAIGFDGEVAWPTKVLLEDPHYIYSETNQSKAFYYVSNVAQTTDAQDYGNWYNLLKHKFDHKIFIGYNNETNESIWQDIIGTVAYFDSQENDGTNYTITWHTEHSEYKQFRDISDRILANPIEYEFDGKNLWFTTKDIPMTANEMRYIVIEMDGKIELGEQSHKYDIMWKPSHQSIAEARAAGNIYVLDPYLNVSYPFRVGPIYLNQSQIADAHNNFPLQLFKNITGFEGYHSVVTVNNTRVPCENESYSNNNLSLWYKTNISNVTNPEIYVYASPNLVANDSTYGSEAVWSEYEAVWLMNEDPTGTITDRTGNGHNGTPSGMVSGDLIDDDYGKRINFDGTDAFIDFGAFPFLIGANKVYTIGLDISFDVHAGNRLVFAFNFDDSCSAGDLYSYYASATGTIKYGDSAVESDSGVSYSGDTTRHFWTSTYTGTNFIVYENGVSKYDNAHATNIYNEAKVLKFGDNYNVAHLDGKIGFGYVTTESLSVDYTLTQSKNINNPTAVGTTSSYNSTGDVQYYADSLHYNDTSPYNHTITDVITANRSIDTADDTNWTSNSTETSHWIFTTSVTPAGYTNFTISNNNLDNFTTWNLTASTQYDLKNSTGTVESQTTNVDGNATFKIDLVAGDYWIESAGISITRTSQTPTTIYDNSTGTFQVIWDVEHGTGGLNHSRIYHMWNMYDFGIDCYCNSIRYPPNNKAANFTPTSEYILRQDNRNGTALFEDDTRVTEGNIWKWGGLDRYSSRMNIVEIDSTNTRIYINGSMQDMVFPNSWPLNRVELEDATKTPYSIYVNHPIIIQWYDIEAAKGHSDYIVSPYFDTELNGLTPTFPIEIYYHNGSFDPLGAVDIEDSPDLVYVTSITGLDWINWTYSPRPNADYINGVYLNSSSIVNAGVTPDKDSFWYLKSQTSPSRAYDIMLANSATSTNISFADTDLLWIGDSAPYTPHPYTASSFTSFSRGEHQINYRLFVTDNNSVNATSTNYTSNISASVFPPTNPTINHFHYQNETDYDMDGIYSGNFSIGCGVATDPDGGTVTHNLTLHYANNLTLVVIINNTFTDSDITHNGIYFDANFSSEPYYSDTLQYTLKIVAVDDEGYTSESWLGKNFTLTPTVNISGYITNILELPIENARIDINSDYVFTNSSGYYEIFEIIPGLNNITIRAIGYSNKYDTINMINTSISNYTLKERRSPSKATGFEFILCSIIILTVVFITRKPKQF